MDGIVSTEHIGTCPNGYIFLKHLHEDGSKSYELRAPPVENVIVTIDDAPIDPVETEGDL